MLPSAITVIDAGEIEQMRDVISAANLDKLLVQEIRIRPNSSGGIETRGGLGVITGKVIVRGLGPIPLQFLPDTRSERFAQLEGEGYFEIQNLEISHFTPDSGDGGAIHALDNSELAVFNCFFHDNAAPGYGGAISSSGKVYTDVRYSKFKFNTAGQYGDHLDIAAALDFYPHAFEGIGNSYYSNSGSTGFENPFGIMEVHSASFIDESGINSTGGVWQVNAILTAPAGSQQLSADRGGSKSESNCNDFGSGAFGSMGYNISSDESCALDQPTDLPGTDPMISLAEPDRFMPLAGSPVIDSGPADVLAMSESDLAFLPCGYRDYAGTARPQDANGDGVFECDRGAVEVPGTGMVEAGHSSVFFNPERNGEGNYVEILDDGRAVVYTFTYNPEGDGPAWFLGVGDYHDNSIVLDELFRPIGTSFGEAYDASEVEFTRAGSMSMVFPDCQADAPGGNVAYTGHDGLGYEGLISRATRLAHITGCGAETAVVNAGLSGTFFDPARNGEGLIVEWLTNGNVLVVFFTYDPDGNQFWMFGQGPSDGNSVTMTAIYPEAFTPWGREYNPADVAFADWGTFTLTWTGCNAMTFDYDSLLAGFGAGSRNYTRLSTLAGTSCPQFQ